MRLPDFKVEQWMNDYENDAIYNMTDTCVKSLTLQELLDLEDFDFSNLTLCNHASFNVIFDKLQFKNLQSLKVVS